jgi:hypothetical protein
VAADVAERYPDGVWLPEFAPIADPVLVPKTVASALGVPEQPGREMTETLVNALRPKALLLVLDSCEHVLLACADLNRGFTPRMSSGAHPGDESGGARDPGGDPLEGSVALAARRPSSPHC